MKEHINSNMENLIKKVEKRKQNVCDKMDTMITLLKKVKPESPCFQNIIKKIYYLDTDIERIIYSIEKIGIDVIKDNINLSDETLENIEDEQNFQEMMKQFLPAMMFYVMCKNS